MHVGLSSDSLGGLLQALSVGLAELTADGHLLRVNRAFADMLDLAELERPGHRAGAVRWLVTDPDSQAPPVEGGVALRDLLAEAEASGLSRPRVLRLSHVDGRELFLRVQAARVHQDDPEVRYGITAADATAEYRLHREILAQREEYRILADHVGDVVLVLDPRRISWVSPSVRPVLGVGPDTLLGLGLADIAHRDDVRGLPPLTPQRTSVSHRLRLRHDDGRQIWFQATVSGRWDADGSLIAVYACLRDIDEQARAEFAVIESERRMRQVFEASPEGYAIYEAVRDRTGAVTGLTLVSMNAGGLAMFPLWRQPQPGQDVTVISPTVRESGMWDTLMGVLETGQLSRTRSEVDLGEGVRFFEGFQLRIETDVLLLSWRNVTDKIEGERLLNAAYDETAEMRATLQTALDATSDGFAVYNLTRGEDGELVSLRVVHANAAGASSLGFDPLDMIDRDLREIFPGAVGSGLWDRIVTAAATGAPQYHRVHVFDDDGQWESSWDNTVAPVGEERMAITWRDVSSEEAALRQLARTRDEAMYSATHDTLTDLPNRALLRQHLGEALRTGGPGHRVGLVFVDLDRFKAINDTYGHAAGDAVLKATASRLGRMVREGDLAARLAGDEFILVLTGLPLDWKPDQFFARASAQLSEPVWVDDVELHPSASLGVVLADPAADGTDVDVLIKQADAEMYRVKAARKVADGKPAARKPADGKPADPR
jgi:diguanylate cyclase (GGDEF)-like protein/PAS domain S-box-containing protein